jgi:hypothetical protein
MPKDIMPNSWTPNPHYRIGLNAENPLYRIGLNAEILNAECDWRPNGAECRIFENQTGLNAEISNADEIPNTELD